MIIIFIVLRRMAVHNKWAFDAFLSCGISLSSLRLISYSSHVDVFGQSFGDQIKKTTAKAAQTTVKTLFESGETFQSI